MTSTISAKSQEQEQLEVHCFCEGFFFMPSIHCLRCSGASHIGSRVLARCLQNVGVRRMHNSGEADIFEELGDLPLPTMLFNLCKMKPSEVQMICARHCPQLENRIATRSLHFIWQLRAAQVEPRGV